MRKTAAALAALALSMSLVGCNGGSDDECYDDEAGGTSVELVAAVDGRSGGSSGGGSRGGGSKSGSKAKPGKGVGAGVSGRDDDCDDD